MKLYAIIDKRLPGVSNVFPSASDGYAVRSLQMAPKDNNPMFMFPDDYKLVCIGEVDELEGAVTPCKYDVVEFSAISVGVSND